MDGWTDGRTDERTDQRTDRPLDGRTHPLIESWLTTKNDNPQAIPKKNKALGRASGDFYDFCPEQQLQSLE